MDIKYADITETGLSVEKTIHLPFMATRRRTRTGMMMAAKGFMVV